MQTMSFTKAATTFFPRHPGQTLADLAKELGELTMDDRMELAPLLATELGAVVEVSEKGSKEIVGTFSPA